MSCFFLLTILSCTLCYLPVVLLHGFGMQSEDMELLASVIRSDHEGTEVHSIPFFAKEKSACSLLVQTKFVLAAIMKLKEDKGWDAFNMIGFSQGGMISRTVLEMMDNNTVDTYISLAGVQMGFFENLPSFMLPFLPPEYRSIDYHDLYEVFYTPNAQYNTSYGSIANGWHDPKHLENYMKGNSFLPVFNNEVHENEKYKTNFLKIKKAHFFTSPEDGVVIPYQSSIFGFYDYNTESNTTIREMKDQAIFKDDTFGLKTLFDEKRLFLHTIPNIPHPHWVMDENVIRTNVVPLLS